MSEQILSHPSKLKRLTGQLFLAAIPAIISYLILSYTIFTPTSIESTSGRKSWGQFPKNAVGYLAISLTGTSLGIWGWFSWNLVQRQQRFEQKLIEKGAEIEQAHQTNQQLQILLTEETQKLKKQKKLEASRIEEIQKLNQQKEALKENFQQEESNYLTELENLTQAIESLEQEKEFYQREQAQLNSRIDALTEQLQDRKKEENTASKTSSSPSDFKVAIIGGHPDTCREVSKALRDEYDLQCSILTPTSKNQTSNLKTVKQTVKDANLIAVIAGYNKHAYSKHISTLKNAGKLEGKVITISNCRGSSGLLREILEAV
jgi:DNA repair exonuclease SbcCD ATPase subunit